MTQWQDVCSVSDLQANSGICALVAGKQVAIFYVPAHDAGQPDLCYAVGNYDPIGQANVLSRGICGDIHGQTVVASPLYKQHFNLLTGACLEDAEVSIPAYGVRIQNDRVEVNVGGGA
ncbi:MAG: nitrite reductase small subunit NirD [Methylococcales bacterium]